MLRSDADESPLEGGSSFGVGATKPCEPEGGDTGIAACMPGPAVGGAPGAGVLGKGAEDARGEGASGLAGSGAGSVIAGCCGVSAVFSTVPSLSATWATNITRTADTATPASWKNRFPPKISPRRSLRTCKVEGLSRRLRTLFRKSGGASILGRDPRARICSFKSRNRRAHDGHPAR